MKQFYITAGVLYTADISANTEEEAIDRFVDECPYEVDTGTIEVETIEESEEV